MRFTLVLREFARLAVFATCMSAASAATVSGRLAYPGEELPAMAVIARNVETGETVRIDTRANQTRYRLELPAGVWVLFAAPRDALAEGQPPLRGAHTVYSQCARDRRRFEAGECRTGALVELRLADRQRVDRVDIDDWYLREEIARSLSLEEKLPQRLDNFFDTELRFAGYPAPVARFIPKPPNFSRAPGLARETRVELEAAAASGADYSREVAVARWSCGRACENWALADLASGNIYLPEALWATVRANIPCDFEPIEYRLDSRLLRLHRLDGDNIRTQTFLWSNEDHVLTPSVEGVAPIADFCAASAQRNGE